MTHSLPDLPYEKSALEPNIDARTMAIHHDKHHQAYVTNLNGMIEGTENESRSLEEIIRSSSGGLFNNAAQVWKTICGRELTIGLILLALIKMFTIVLARMRQRWEDTQRHFEIYHERGGRFTAKHLMTKR